MYMEKTPTGTFLLNMFIKIKSIAVSFLVQSVPLSSVIDTLIFYSKYKIMMLHKIHIKPKEKKMFLHISHNTSGQEATYFLFFKVIL